MQGERRQSLVQTIDLAPTVLDFFGLEIPKDMMGKSLKDTISRDEPVRKYGIFGYHGGPIDITDGRWVYMRAVQDSSVPANEYTMMTTHMNSRFSPKELQQVSLAEPFGFTKGVRPLKIPASGGLRFQEKLKENRLYDLEKDPFQREPIHDPQKEAEMAWAMEELLKENEAPKEIYWRYGFPGDIMTHEAQ